MFNPVQDAAAREAGVLAAGRWTLPGLHFIHSVQVLGSLASLVVTDSQACAASAAATGHAPAASSAEQKANLKSIGLTRPAAVSHASKGLGAPIHSGRGLSTLVQPGLSREGARAQLVCDSAWGVPC